MHVFVPAGARTHMRESKVNHSARREHHFQDRWNLLLGVRMSKSAQACTHGYYTMRQLLYTGDNCGLDFFSFHLWGCKDTKKSR